jgi:hypothetical protein
MLVHHGPPWRFNWPGLECLCSKRSYQLVTLHVKFRSPRVLKALSIQTCKIFLCLFHVRYDHVTLRYAPKSNKVCGPKVFVGLCLGITNKRINSYQIIISLCCSYTFRQLCAILRELVCTLSYMPIWILVDKILYSVWMCVCYVAASAKWNNKLIRIDAFVCYS